MSKGRRALRGCAMATLLLIAAGVTNIKVYTDAPDPDRGGQTIHGIVYIAPNIDQCFGVEMEDVTHHVDFFGGECE